MSNFFPPFHAAFLNAFTSPLELAVVFLAVLMLFGAKSLPEMLRTFGRWSEQLRRVSREVQRELMDIETPFRDASAQWEKEMKDFTVSSSRRPNPQLPPPKDLPADAPADSAAPPASDTPARESGDA